MRLRIFRSVFVLVCVFLHYTPSLSLFYIQTEELGYHLCGKTPESLSTCRNVTSHGLDSVFHVNASNSDPNIATPRIAIFAKNGLDFNVRFRNGKIIHKVRAFAQLGEVNEVDVELMDTSVSYQIGCYSYGYFSKVSTNILMSSDTTHKTQYENDFYPNLHVNTVIESTGKILQSGRYTCLSIGKWNNLQTIRIFTEPSAENDPFVTHEVITGEIKRFWDRPELTIQSDGTSNGFVVPCRTNRRMKSPPFLLWKKRWEDNLTMLSAEELKAFRWDPSVGFQFNSSNWMWEMQYLVCQFGTFEKLFLPTSSRFETSIFVTGERDYVGCSITPRNASSLVLFGSGSENRKARYYKDCNTYIECDVAMQLGLHLYEQSYRELAKHRFDMTDLDAYKTFGVLTCFLEHSYEGEIVPEIRSGVFFLGLDSNVYVLPGSYPNSSVIQISKVDAVLYKTQMDLYYVFTCTTVDFVMSEEVYLILRFKDNTETVQQYFNPNRISTPVNSSKAQFNVTLETNMTEAMCLMLTLDRKVVSVKTPLQIVDVFAPTIDNSVVACSASNSRTFKIGDLNDDHKLTCPIIGAPQPKYRWHFNPKNTNLVQGANSRNLMFRHLHTNMTGEYICEAWNKYGRNSFKFQVRVLPQGVATILGPPSIALITVGVLICVILLGVAVVFAFKYFRAKRQLRNLTPEEALEFLNGIAVSNGASHVDGAELAVQLPFTKFIESKSLVVARDSILGKGQFGIVYRGILHTEAVAVKTFRCVVTYDEFRAGLVEVKLMSFVDEHPNIVKFMGADVTNIEKREILIVMELSPIGSLEKHLRLVRPSIQSNYVSTTSSYYTTDDRLTFVNLFGYCEQIAYAMEHLESKKVIHGDLAARNILVFSHGVVKVTDFGYSRQLYENNMYKPKKNRALPWRWASMELLRRMEFSTESDIWAFGVTIWEIFTFGNVPFASEKWNDNFMDSLENGSRLNKPAGLSKPQYSFLKECWNLEKSARPKFAVLKSFFSIEKENLRQRFATSEV